MHWNGTFNSKPWNKANKEAKNTSVPKNVLNVQWIHFFRSSEELRWTIEFAEGSGERGGGRKGGRGRKDKQPSLTS